VDAGLPETCLVIAGQPHLEVVARELKGSDVALQAASIRQAWLDEDGEGEDPRLTSFASEAISQDFGPETPYYRCHTETDALDDLMEAVELARADGKPTVRVEADLLAWPCILAADIIVGMTLRLLLESALAGRPTFSYQPGFERPKSFVGTRVGMVPSASSIEELAALLVSGLQGISQAAGAGEFAFQGAADRVAEEVLQLVADGRVNPRADVS